MTTHDLGQTRCAIVTAKIDGLPAEQAARELGRAGVNLSTTCLPRSALGRGQGAQGPVLGLAGG